jgi:hypothetical protein
MLTSSRDHLKQVHHLQAKVCKNDLNFKSKPFTSLKTIELKWKLVFQRLFPKIEYEDIPSPCTYRDLEEVIAIMITDLQMRTKTGQTMEQTVLALDRTSLTH